MQNFADQCLDMARAMLSHNLGSINADGTIAPVDGEAPRDDESGHAALALGEFHRATAETDFEGHDLIDLAARCITAQAFADEEAENGLGYAALGLLSFGPAKERNTVWERLLDPTREQLDRRLLARSDYTDHYQAFNIAKAVTRYSMGLSKKDETGRLVDRYVERCEKHSSAGFLDDGPERGVGGVFDLYGPMSLVFIRQAIQLHGNIHLRDRKLPSLRTIADKYLKLLPDLVRADGLGWAFGRGIGAYGQMHCISIILQSMRDGWISEEKRAQYLDLLRRLFQFFFMSYLDQEAGFLVIRDGERNTQPQHTTRMANFDGVRYLCQWSRLARSIGGPMTAQAAPVRNAGRWVIFDKSNKKEQGLFIYQHPESSLHVHVPLVGANGRGTADSLAFPHFPGIFDWPSDTYLPILVPELKFGDKLITPSFYGRRCVTGLGLRQSFYFRYEQPELITVDEKIVPGLGSAKVAWTFSGQKITSEFTFQVKSPVTCDHMRYMLAIGGPHSEKHVPMTFMLGPNGLGCTVEKDDFHATWQETEVVTNEPAYRTYWGNLHYLQTLVRDHPLNMRPGIQYKLVISFEPDIALLDA
jgi:hypothetical protein